jgi:hypothetical protein
MTTWTNLPNVPSEQGIERAAAFVEMLGEPANDDPAVRTEGTGVWVQESATIEPGGFELERTVLAEPCPRCGATAERCLEERAEGSLNIYDWVECRACGYQKGDIPDDRWWPMVLNQDEVERRCRIEAQDRENERRWRLERRLEEVRRCYGPSSR